MKTAKYNIYSIILEYAYKCVLCTLNTCKESCAQKHNNSIDNRSSQPVALSATYISLLYNVFSSLRARK